MIRETSLNNGGKRNNNLIAFDSNDILEANGNLNYLYNGTGQDIHYENSGVGIY